MKSSYYPQVDQKTQFTKFIKFCNLEPLIRVNTIAYFEKGKVINRHTSRVGSYKS